MEVKRQDYVSTFGPHGSARFPALRPPTFPSPARDPKCDTNKTHLGLARLGWLGWAGGLGLWWSDLSV